MYAVTSVPDSPLTSCAAPYLLASSVSKSGGEPYLGDTAKKDWHVDVMMLAQVGLPYSAPDKFPDLVFWLEDREWLVLVEAVTSHGPVSPKRRAELEDLLKDSPHHRVYVTAFASRKDFKQHMDEIAWETEVWVAEVPDHMIHYNGPKFLAPFPDEERP